MLAMSELFRLDAENLELDVAIRLPQAVASKGVVLELGAGVGMLGWELFDGEPLGFTSSSMTSTAIASSTTIIRMRAISEMMR